MSVTYIQIGLLLVALYLLVQMTRYSGPKPDKMLSAAGTAVQSAVDAIFVHPQDPLVAGSSQASNPSGGVWVHPDDPVVAGSSQSSNPSTVGVWNGQVAQVVPSAGLAINSGTANGSLLGSAKEGLSVQPVDYDSIFKPASIQPSDLIPKFENELYPGMSANLDQNFMTNELQAGLPTSNRRKFIDDIRPIYPNPITVTTPFGNPTTFPDVSRRSLCDL